MDDDIFLKMEIVILENTLDNMESDLRYLRYENDRRDRTIKELESKR